MKELQQEINRIRKLIKGKEDKFKWLTQQLEEQQKYINNEEEEEEDIKCHICRKYVASEDYHHNTSMCMECRYENDENDEGDE